MDARKRNHISTIARRFSRSLSKNRAVVKWVIVGSEYKISDGTWLHPGFKATLIGGREVHIPVAICYSPANRIVGLLHEVLSQMDPEYNKYLLRDTSDYRSSSNRVLSTKHIDRGPSEILAKYLTESTDSDT